MTLTKKDRAHFEKRLLEGRGYQLDVATSGPEALTYVNVSRPTSS